MHARIIGTGSYLPPKVLTNRDLERMVDTSDEWIVTRTGIRQRHIAGDDEMASDLALEASRRRSPRPASGRPTGPDRRCDDHAGHGLPQHRLHSAGEAGRWRLPGLRRAGGVQRFRLCARHRGPVLAGGPVPLCVGGRNRGVFAHSRLDRSLHLRAVRRRGRGGGAGGQRATGDLGCQAPCRRKLRQDTVRSRARSPAARCAASPS